MSRGSIRLLPLVLAALAALGASACLAQPTERLGDGDLLRGRFVQERHLAGFERPLAARGDFLIAGGRGLIWRTVEPIASTAVIGPAAILQVTEGTAPVRLPVGGSGFATVLQQLLRGALVNDWSSLAEAFEIERVQEGDRWRATLVPRSAALRRDIAAIALAGGRFVEHVVLRKAGDDRDEIRFYDQVVSRGTPDPAEAALLDSVAQ